MVIRCDCRNEECESYISFNICEDHCSILMESKNKLPILIYPNRDDLFDLYLELKNIFSTETKKENKKGKRK